MKIAAIVTVKQGDLYEAIRKLGWTQSDLARAAKISPTEIGRFINMKQRPSPESANKIQKALAKKGVFIDVLATWPDTFKLHNNRAAIVGEIDPIFLMPKQQATPRLEAMTTECREVIDEVLKTLSRKEAEIIERRFFYGDTLNELGKSFGVRGNTIRVQEARALRKMRHPSRFKLVEPYMSMFEEREPNPTDSECIDAEYVEEELEEVATEA